MYVAADWPVPPSQEPWCSTCPAGWASETVDAVSCEMCPKGTYASQPLSPECSACPTGTYASSWGSTRCNHCIVGTFAPDEVRQLIISDSTSWRASWCYLARYMRHSGHLYNVSENECSQWGASCDGYFWMHTKDSPCMVLARKLVSACLPSLMCCVRTSCGMPRMHAACSCCKAPTFWCTGAASTGK